MANWREKSFEQSSQSTRSFLKGSSPLYIHIYIYTIVSTRNDQSGRATFKEVVLRTATAIFPSLPFWLRLTVVRARGRIVNRPRGAIARAAPHAQGSRVRVHHYTRARHRHTVCGRWRVTGEPGRRNSRSPVKVAG